MHRITLKRSWRGNELPTVRGQCSATRARFGLRFLLEFEEGQQWCWEMADQRRKRNGKHPLEHSTDRARQARG
ncbi:hypothetical protein C2L65_26870 [Paraburkholderia terrae]|uniref:Uncharacterized protein n=1 Tax=Paraburkholderia terrae TaxID=311230 RepID=A0A2I8EV77_9BURK|nr:hypothetical protein C2L65_26870 [Paraburkholderia terrae]